MRQYEQYTNLSDEQCALPGSFAVFALGMLGQDAAGKLVWDYLDLCDDEHSHLQEKFLREYVKQFGFTADTVPIFVRGVLSMQNMKYSKDYAAWMANAESLDALLEAKIHLSEIVPSGFSSDEDDDDDENEEPAQETEASPGGSAAIRMGDGLLCDLGQSQRQGWSKSGGNSSGGTERAVSGNFSIGGNKMKTFDPNYKLLDEMYQDDYYPAFLVDKVKDGLQKVIDLLEGGETNIEVIQNTLDKAVCGINDLQDEFYENDSEIETVARDCIGDTVAYILEWFGIPIDIEEAIRERDW